MWWDTLNPALRKKSKQTRLHCEILSQKQIKRGKNIEFYITTDLKNQYYENGSFTTSNLQINAILIKILMPFFKNIEKKS